MKTEIKRILLKDIFVPIIAAAIGAAVGAFISGRWFSDSLIVNIDGESITVHSVQYEELVNENATLRANNLVLNTNNSTLIADSLALSEENEELRNNLDSLKHDIEQYENILNHSDKIDIQKIRLLNNGLEQTLTESTVLFYNERPFFPLNTLIDIYPEEISFDSKNLTIMLGEKVPEKGYLLSVCPPYQTDNNFDSPAYMTMCGDNYLYGIQMNWDSGFSYYNLNGEYTTLEFDLGHIDGGDMVDGILQIYLDGQFAKEYTLSCNSLVQHYILELKGAHQMKFEWSSNQTFHLISYGMANITIS